MRINGARIHCERSGAGVPVVFLHAGLADSRMWWGPIPSVLREIDL